MRIYTAEIMLSDGSRVFNVVLQQNGKAISLDAVSERDAEKLVEALHDVIDAHTNTVVRA